jgi:hypothetical protein
VGQLTLSIPAGVAIATIKLLASLRVHFLSDDTSQNAIQVRTEFFAEGGSCFIDSLLYVSLAVGAAIISVIGRVATAKAFDVWIIIILVLVFIVVLIIVVLLLVWLCLRIVPLIVRVDEMII